MIVINDRHADGRDVSWLWDVDFEMLAEGAAPLDDRRHPRRGHGEPAQVRRRAPTTGSVSLEPDPGAAIDRSSTSIPEGGRGYILPTYTAMLDLRANLAERGAVEQFWEQ